MGIFSRFTDIVNSNINNLLDKAEDPKKMVRLIIQEMEDTLVEVRSSSAKTLADKKELTRQISRFEQEAQQWQDKAELALSKDREDLARAALMEKKKCNESAEALSQELSHVEEHIGKLQDEVVQLQEKLLRVVEYGEFERVGGSRAISTDVRLIAATNEDLPTLAASGEFRADLLDRLAFDVITLPPLRERLEDILMLAEHFAINMARELEFELFSGFTEKAKRSLLEYHWPGNIRELKNVVERSVYRCNNPHLPVHDLIIDPFDSPFRPTQQVKTNDRVTVVKAPEDLAIEPSPIIENNSVSQNNVPLLGEFPQSLKNLSQQYEIEIIQSALAHCQFNQKKTADALELTYHQLRGYLKKYNLLDGSINDEA